MDLTKETELRKKFKQIILDLASSQTLLKQKSDRAKFYCRLEELYWCENGENNFRHFYSDIFRALTEIQDDYAKGSIDVLGENLNIIRKGYKPLNWDNDGNKIDITDNINKLYDHANLDIARMSYANYKDHMISSDRKIKDINEKVQSIKNEFKDTEKKLLKTNKKLDDIQKEYITILGIFASIVLSFTAAITFSTSVFENIHKSSIYRIAFITLIVGLIFTNLIYGLIYYINIIVNKEKKDIKIIIWTDIIVVLLMVCVFWAWKDGFVERRDNEIKQQNTVQEQLT